jgi:hypothetical protein
MHDVDAGGELEQLAAEVLEAADAGRRVIEFTWLLLGESNQLLDGLIASTFGPVAKIEIGVNDLIGS